MNILLNNKIRSHLDNWLDKWNTNQEKRVVDKKNLPTTTLFLVNFLDESINLVEYIFSSGKDKKAAVLLMVAYMFDQVILKNLPVYLKPFSFFIRLFFVQVLSSVLIDFIVSKYNSGSWNQNKEEK